MGDIRKHALSWRYEQERKKELQAKLEFDSRERDETLSQEPFTPSIFGDREEIIERQQPISPSTILKEDFQFTWEGSPLNVDEDQLLSPEKMDAMSTVFGNTLKKQNKSVQEFFQGWDRVNKSVDRHAITTFDLKKLPSGPEYGGFHQGAWADFFDGMNNAWITGTGGGVKMIMPMLMRSFFGEETEGNEDIVRFTESWLDKGHNWYVNDLRRLSDVSQTGSIFDNANAMMSGLGQGVGSFAAIQTVLAGAAGATYLSRGRAAKPTASLLQAMLKPSRALSNKGQWAAGISAATLTFAPMIYNEAKHSGLSDFHAARFTSFLAPVIGASEYAGFHLIGKVMSRPFVAKAIKSGVTEGVRQIGKQGITNKTFGAFSKAALKSFWAELPSVRIASQRFVSGALPSMFTAGLIEGTEEFGQYYIEKIFQDKYDKHWSKVWKGEAGNFGYGNPFDDFASLERDPATGRPTKFRQALEEAFIGAVVGGMMGFGGGMFNSEMQLMTLHQHIGRISQMPKGQREAKLKELMATVDQWGEYDNSNPGLGLNPQQQKFAKEQIESLTNFNGKVFDAQSTNWLYKKTGLGPKKRPLPSDVSQQLYVLYNSLKGLDEANAFWENQFKDKKNTAGWKIIEGVVENNKKHRKKVEEAFNGIAKNKKLINDKTFDDLITWDSITGSKAKADSKQAIKQFMIKNGMEKQWNDLEAEMKKREKAPKDVKPTGVEVKEKPDEEVKEEEVTLESLHKRQQELIEMKDKLTEQEKKEKEELKEGEQLVDQFFSNLQNQITAQGAFVSLADKRKMIKYLEALMKLGISNKQVVDRMNKRFGDELRRPFVYSGVATKEEMETTPGSFIERESELELAEVEAKIEKLKKKPRPTAAPPKKLSELEEQDEYFKERGFKSRTHLINAVNKYLGKKYGKEDFEKITLEEINETVKIRDEEKAKKEVKEVKEAPVAPVAPDIQTVTYKGNTYSVDFNAGSITNTKTGKVLKGGVTSSIGSKIVDIAISQQEAPVAPVTRIEQEKKAPEVKKEPKKKGLPNEQTSLNDDNISDEVKKSVSDWFSKTGKPKSDEARFGIGGHSSLIKDNPLLAAFIIKELKKVFPDLNIEMVEELFDNYGGEILGKILKLDAKINKNQATQDIIVHEALHPFLKILKHTDKKLYDAALKLFKNTEAFKRAKALYPYRSEEAQLIEAIIDSASQRTTQKLEDKFKGEGKPFLTKLKNWLKKFWNKIKLELGLLNQSGAVELISEKFLKSRNLSSYSFLLDEKIEYARPDYLVKNEIRNAVARIIYLNMESVSEGNSDAISDKSTASVIIKNALINYLKTQVDRATLKQLKDTYNKKALLDKYKKELSSEDFLKFKEQVEAFEAEEIIVRHYASHIDKVTTNMFTERPALQESGEGGLKFTVEIPSSLKVLLESLVDIEGNPVPQSGVWRMIADLGGKYENANDLMLELKNIVKGNKHDSQIADAIYNFFDSLDEKISGPILNNILSLVQRNAQSINASTQITFRNKTGSIGDLKAPSIDLGVDELRLSQITEGLIKFHASVNYINEGVYKVGDSYIVVKPQQTKEMLPVFVTALQVLKDKDGMNRLAFKLGYKNSAEMIAFNPMIANWVKEKRTKLYLHDIKTLPVKTELKRSELNQGVEVIKELASLVMGLEKIKLKQNNSKLLKVVRDNNIKNLDELRKKKHKLRKKLTESDISQMVQILNDLGLGISVDKINSSDYFKKDNYKNFVNFVKAFIDGNKVNFSLKIGSPKGYLGNFLKESIGSSTRSTNYQNVEDNRKNSVKYGSWADRSFQLIKNGDERYNSDFYKNNPLVALYKSLKEDFGVNWIEQMNGIVNTDIHNGTEMKNIDDIGYIISQLGLFLNELAATEKNLKGKKTYFQSAGILADRGTMETVRVLKMSLEQAKKEYKKLLEFDKTLKGRTNEKSKKIVPSEDKIQKAIKDIIKIIKEYGVTYKNESISEETIEAFIYNEFINRYYLTQIFSGNQYQWKDIKDQTKRYGMVESNGLHIPLDKEVYFVSLKDILTTEELNKLFPDKSAVESSDSFSFWSPALTKFVQRTAGPMWGLGKNNKPVASEVDGDGNSFLYKTSTVEANEDFSSWTDENGIKQVDPVYSKINLLNKYFEQKYGDDVYVIMAFDSSIKSPKKTKSLDLNDLSIEQDLEGNIKLLTNIDSFIEQKKIDNLRIQQPAYHDFSTETLAALASQLSKIVLTGKTDNKISQYEELLSEYLRKSFEEKINEYDDVNQILKSVINVDGGMGNTFASELAALMIENNFAALDQQNVGNLAQSIMLKALSNAGVRPKVSGTDLHMIPDLSNKLKWINKDGKTPNEVAAEVHVPEGFAKIGELLVLVRIPASGYFSVFLGKVVGHTPGKSNTIRTPSGYIKASNADFDYDKLFTYRLKKDRKGRVLTDKTIRENNKNRAKWNALYKLWGRNANRYYNVKDVNDEVHNVMSNIDEAGTIKLSIDNMNSFKEYEDAIYDALKDLNTIEREDNMPIVVLRADKKDNSFIKRKTQSYDTKDDINVLNNKIHKMLTSFLSDKNAIDGAFVELSTSSIKDDINKINKKFLPKGEKIDRTDEADLSTIIGLAKMHTLTKESKASVGSSAAANKLANLLQQERITLAQSIPFIKSDGKTTILKGFYTDNKVDLEKRIVAMAEFLQMVLDDTKEMLMSSTGINQKTAFLGAVATMLGVNRVDLFTFFRSKHIQDFFNKNKYDVIKDTGNKGRIDYWSVIAYRDSIEGLKKEDRVYKDLTFLSDLVQLTSELTPLITIMQLDQGFGSTNDELDMAIGAFKPVKESIYINVNNIIDKRPLFKYYKDILNVAKNSVDDKFLTSGESFVNFVENFAQKNGISWLPKKLARELILRGLANDEKNYTYESVSKFISNFPKMVLNLQSNSIYSDNAFLRLLRVESKKHPKFKSIVPVSVSIQKGFSDLTLPDRKRIRESFLKLPKDAQRAIVDYLIFTDGFYSKTNNYLEILPLEYTQSFLSNMSSLLGNKSDIYKEGTDLNNKFNLMLALAFSQDIKSYNTKNVKKINGETYIRMPYKKVGKETSEAPLDFIRIGNFLYKYTGESTVSDKITYAKYKVQQELIGLKGKNWYNISTEKSKFGIAPVMDSNLRPEWKYSFFSREGNKFIDRTSQAQEFNDEANQHIRDNTPLKNTLGLFFYTVNNDIKIVDKTTGIEIGTFGVRPEENHSPMELANAISYQQDKEKLTAINDFIKNKLNQDDIAPNYEATIRGKTEKKEDTGDGKQLTIGFTFNDRVTSVSQEVLDKVGEEKIYKKILEQLSKMYPDIINLTDLQAQRRLNELAQGAAWVEGYKRLVSWALNDGRIENAPHEYAHHFVDMFRDSKIVQKGIRLYGEENLVEKMGKLYTKRMTRGTLYNLARDFWIWLKDMFGGSSVVEILEKEFAKGKKAAERKLGRARLPRKKEYLVGYRGIQGYEDGAYFDAKEANILFENEDANFLSVQDNVEETNQFLDRIIEKEQVSEIEAFERLMREYWAVYQQMRPENKPLGINEVVIDSIMKKTSSQWESTYDSYYGRAAEKTLIKEGEELHRMQSVLRYQEAIAGKLIVNSSELGAKTQDAGFIASAINKLNDKIQKQKAKNHPFLNETLLPNLRKIGKIKVFFGELRNIAHRWSLNDMTISELVGGEFQNTFKEVFSTPFTFKADDQRKQWNFEVQNIIQDLIVTIDKLNNFKKKKSSYLSENVSIVDNLKNLEDISTEELLGFFKKGKSFEADIIKISPAELISLYLSLSQEPIRNSVLLTGEYKTKKTYLSRYKGLKIKEQHIIGGSGVFFSLRREVNNGELYNNNVHFTEQEWGEIKNKVESNETYMEVVNAVRKITKYLEGVVSSPFLLQNGVELKTRPNYWPTPRGRKAQITRVRKASFNDISFLKEASISHAMPAAISDVFMLLNQLTTQLTFYGAYSVPVANARKVLNQLKGRSNIDQFYLSKVENTLDKLEDPRILQGFMDKEGWEGIKKFMNTMQVAVLGLNVPVMFKQYGSFFLAANEIEYKYLVGAFPTMVKTTFEGVKTWSIPFKQIELLREFAEVSPFISDRVAGRFDVDTSEISARADWGGMDRSGGVIRIKIPFSKMAQGKDVTLSVQHKTLLKGIMIFDTAAVLAIYKASKAKIADTTGLQPGTKEFNKAAAKLAEYIIKRTQPVYDISNRSWYLQQRGNLLLAGLTMFTTQLMQNYNMMIRSINAYNIDPTPENRKRMLHAIGSVMVLNSVYIGGINAARGVLMGYDDDDENFGKYWAKQSALSSFGNIPIVGPFLGGAVYSRMDSKPWVQNVNHPMLDAISSGADAISYTLKGDFYNGAYKALRVWSMHTGMPTFPVSAMNRANDVVLGIED